MAGGEATGYGAGASVENPSLAVHKHIRLVQDVIRISASGFSGPFKKDCSDLARRVSLLGHLVDEIREFKGDLAQCSLPCSWLCDFSMALEAAKILLLDAMKIDTDNGSSNGPSNKFFFRFHCVTWKLERALADVPYGYLHISEEVREQVELVRSQLRKAVDRYGGPLNSSFLSRTLSQPLNKDIYPLQQGNRVIRSLSEHHLARMDLQVREKSSLIQNIRLGVDQVTHEQRLSCSEKSEDLLSRCSDADALDTLTNTATEENKKCDFPIVPEDFLCPISLEVMRDPVVVCTGQTYERSYIQRWIDGGNTTCPKTQQKLEKLTLTPNTVLRSIISQWCAENNIEQPTALTSGKIRKSDGSVRDVTGDIAAIEVLVQKLSSQLIIERRAAIAEIRSLSKRSTDNRILIADAGAIPILVNLLTSEEGENQENAVTSILNLSIYEDNKGLIMLAGAVPAIIQVLRCGTMEARENAAATLFSLSLTDENKIIIGESGAVPALVKLLQNGSPRGRRDAATALFNLCIYLGNKGKAIRAGIVPVLLNMVTDLSIGMVDEALTILSILAGHQDAMAVIVKDNAIPILIDLTRAVLPRNKENAVSILLALCKRDQENLAFLSKLGAVIPLTELSRNGTERAKRKANSLLEQLCQYKQL